MRISPPATAFAVLSALALTACGDDAGDRSPGSTDPYADSEVLAFACGETEVEARFLPETARIVVDSATYDLTRAGDGDRAETGTRYEAPSEPALAFTAMGETAILSLPGDPDLECRLVDA
ncbi:hypothetical protein ACWCOP_02400 [Maricaulaceae bacterium MS644]